MCICRVVTTSCFIPQHFDDGFVEQKVDVFDVIVCLVLPMWLLLGFSWVDALENAQAPVVMRVFV